MTRTEAHLGYIYDKYLLYGPQVTTFGLIEKYPRYEQLGSRGAKGVSTGDSSGASTGDSSGDDVSWEAAMPTIKYVFFRCDASEGAIVAMDPR